MYRKKPFSYTSFATASAEAQSGESSREVRPGEIGERGDLAAQLGQAHRGERAPQLGQPQCEQRERDDLPGERLRRRHADLATAARVQRRVGLARELASHHVGDGQDAGAARARDALRGDRVGRLARLRDRDRERALVEHRAAVARLGCDVDLDGDARPLLEQVAADEPRVEGGAAGGDRDALDAVQQLVVRTAELERDAAALQALADRLAHRLGLLVDLLEHERLVAALLGGRLVPVDDRLGALELATLDVVQGDALGRDGDQLAVLDLLDAPRLREEGHDVRRDERLALADAEHERALQARADDQIGMQRRDDDEGEVPDELAVGAAHGLDEIARRSDARSGAAPPRRPSPTRTRARRRSGARAARRSSR